VNERETRNNDFQDFSASFSPVSDAKPGLEVVEETTVQAKTGCFPAFEGEIAFLLGKKTPLCACN
jgi:hypothetical protein